MTRVVNEDALRKHLVNKHGDELAETYFAPKLAEAQRHVAELNALEDEMAQSSAELADYEAHQPSLDAARKAMDAAGALFVAKTEAFNTLQASNAGKSAAFRAKLDSIADRIRAVGTPSMHGGWVKVASQPQPFVPPPLVKGTDADPARQVH